MYDNNRFFSFFESLYHVYQESVGCTVYTRLGFSKSKMASKMAAKSHLDYSYNQKRFSGLTISFRAFKI